MMTEVCRGGDEYVLYTSMCQKLPIQTETRNNWYPYTVLVSMRFKVYDTTNTHTQMFKHVIILYMFYVIMFLLSEFFIVKQIY